MAVLFATNITQAIIDLGPPYYLVYGLTITQKYDQSGGDEFPEPNITDPYCFFATVIGTSSLGEFGIFDYVEDPSIIPPIQAEDFYCNMNRETIEGIDAFKCLVCTDLLEEFNVMYPLGTYTANVQFYYLDFLTASIVTNSVMLEAEISGSNYPDTPQFIDLPANNVVRAGQDFQLKWNPNTSGETNGIVTIQVFKVINPLVEGELVDSIKTENLVDPGKYTLSGDKLLPDTDYYAQITFENSINISSSSGLQGLLPDPDENNVAVVSTYAKNTAWRFRTQNALVLRITLREGNSSPQVALNFSSKLGSKYDLQATSDFSGWTTILTTNAVAEEVTYVESLGGEHDKRFYRVVEP